MASLMCCAQGVRALAPEQSALASRLDELAAGVAHAIIRIADDLPVVDEIHESLARVMASKMIDMVVGEIDLRGAAMDKPAEA